MHIEENASDVPPPPPLAARLHRWRDVLVGVSLFFVVLFVLWRSPISYFGDSKYSMLVSHSLLTRHTFLLDGYSIPRKPAYPFSGTVLNGQEIYQVEIVGGHYYYYFPPGTSILSVPFVAVMECFGLKPTHSDGSYNPQGELHVQLLLAAILMAALGVIFYFTSRLLLSIPWSLCVALGGVFGTQIWSTASRAMWTHTWGIVLLGGVLYLLLAQEVKRRKANPVLLATLLSWMYFVRPTNSIFILGITVYVFLYHRSLFIPYAVTGALWFAAFVGYSWVHFHTILPHYYAASRLEFTNFGQAIAGDLVSPSRGLLIDVPVTCFVVYLLARHWRRLASPRLAWLGVGTGAGQLFAVAGFVEWSGGDCFGPRYTTELVPWLALTGAMGLGAMLAQEARNAFARRATLVIGGVLLLLSVWINGRGAESPATLYWNVRPFGPAEARYARVWDWTYPQALAGLVQPPMPDVFPKLTGRMRFGGGGATAFQWEGWSESEPRFCWSNGHKAVLIFAADQADASSLKMRFWPFLQGKLTSQRMKIDLNGQPIADLTLTESAEREYVFVLPKGSLRSRNVLSFTLPDAASPHSISGGNDPRVLGIAMNWLELTSAPSAAARSPDDPS